MGTTTSKTVILTFLLYNKNFVKSTLAESENAEFIIYAAKGGLHLPKLDARENEFF